MAGVGGNMTLLHDDSLEAKVEKEEAAIAYIT